MKKAQLKTLMVTVFFILALAISAYALTVTLNSPSGVWVTTRTVTFNFTPTVNDSTLVDWCAIYSNQSDAWNLTANYTNLANGTVASKSIDFVDSNDNGSYVWNVTCSNGTDERSNFKPNFYFGVDATTPSITLDSPDDMTYLNNNITNFTYTPTDPSNLETCLIYHNASGTWGVNETNSSVNSTHQDIVKFTMFDEGEITWNIWCNDSASNSAWAEDTNRTLIIDVTAPSSIGFLYPVSSDVQHYNNDSTPYIVWNYSIDTNFDKYTVRLSNDTAFMYIMQEIDIDSNNTNYTTLSNIELDGEYFIRVGAYDLAGNVVNSTFDMNYTLNRATPTLTLNAPANNTYSDTGTIAFNVTIEDNNPDVCVLYLGNASQGGGNDAIVNATNTSLFNGTPMWITPSTLSDGKYRWNVGCNNTIGIMVNISAVNLNLTVDTVSPTAPSLNISWGLTNSSNKNPEVGWITSTEINFDRYQVQARFFNNGTVAYEANVTNRTVNEVKVNLTANYTYNFSVVAWDLAGNIGHSANTTTSLYYVDPVCGTLSAGWNFCGAIWTSSRNLSRIGLEADATFVSVWNFTNHAWATCNFAVNPGGVNCNSNVSISNYHEGLSIPIGLVNTTATVLNGWNQSAGTYFYKVTALDIDGVETEASAEVSLTLDGAAKNASQILWTAVTGASKYRIYNGTASGVLTTYHTTGNVSFNHTGQPVHGAATPPAAGTYAPVDDSPAVWIYVNSSKEWRNRTWESSRGSANITLSNFTNRWNNVASPFRTGRTFGNLGDLFTPQNVTMFSMPYNNGTSVPFVNIGLYAGLKNTTTFDYGRAMWVYYNGTGESNRTYDVGSW